MSDLKHVAFICDGNGRWAKARGRERTYGHNVGSDVVKDVAIYMKRKYEVSSISFYIFSTENWKRPKHEVMVILKLLDMKMKKWIGLFLEEKVRLKFIGSRVDIDSKLVSFMEKYEKMTEHCNEMTLNLCFNYGGRREIVEAVQNIVRDNIESDNIDEGLLNSYMYTANQEDVDLLIRTSGECRISNFYLWQLAYSELAFVDCYWPDINEEIIDKTIFDYNNRNRRFGGIDED